MAWASWSFRFCAEVKRTVVVMAYACIPAMYTKPSPADRGGKNKEGLRTIVGR